jgi:hypothetical protein
MRRGMLVGKIFIHRLAYFCAHLTCLYHTVLNNLFSLLNTHECRNNDQFAHTFINTPFKFFSEPHAVKESSLNTAELKDVSVKISWGAVTIGNFDDYHVKLSPTGTMPPTVKKGTNVLLIIALTGGTGYTFTITSKYGDIESAIATLKFTTSK